MTLVIDGGPTTGNLRLMVGDLDLVKALDIQRVTIEPMEAHEHIKVTIEVLKVNVDLKLLPKWVQLKLVAWPPGEEDAPVVEEVTYVSEA